MKLAVSTNDKKTFTKEHFGDGKYFQIYEFTSDSISHVKDILNNSPEEHMHGDPNKAMHIGKTLKSEGVSVLVAWAMGPNIVRMRRQFVPVISRVENINEALEKLKGIAGEIEEETHKKPGEDRKVFYLK